VSAKPAAFYDDHMVADDAPAMLPLEESPWRPLYQEAAHGIALNEAVIDLGCGTGRFAHELYRDGERYGAYTGVDFSVETIREAVTYLRRNAIKGEFTFDCIDLAEWQTPTGIGGETVFTCLEVLEHIDDDLALVAKVPAGHRLIFSVPNYHSEAHVRAFQHVGEIWERYAGLLTFRRWSLISLSSTRVIHLVEGVRRTESW
jgi:2-polyprenyl-3-methyl-5-hydroxy-6-metoxy-1,4-benzoquinol methylase